MPNFRGLDQTVSSFKSKGWTLVLVNKVDPASIAIDQLKSDSVIMDHVGDRSAFGNTNVTGDDPATEPRWDQVSVLHPRPANHPRGLVTQMTNDKRVFSLRDGEWIRQRCEFDSKSTGSKDAGVPIRDVGKAVNENSHGP